MLIKVTKSDIKNGCKNDPFSCPVAIAIKKKLGFTVAVTETRIRQHSYSLDNHKKYYQPRSVKRFVQAFDENKKVKPFSFILREI